MIEPIGRSLAMFPASKYEGPSGLDYRERGSHARGVHPTQDTSRMGTPTVKQEEETDTGIIVQESSKKSGSEERGRYKGEKSQTRPN